MVAQLVGIALVTAACAILLRATAPELSLAVSVAGSIVLMIAALDMLKGSLGLFGKIASLTGIDSSFLKILLKMVGVGYLVEFAAGTLTDFGQQALADKLSFAGKAAIFLLALPVFEAVLGLIVKLMELIP